MMARAICSLMKSRLLYTFRSELKNIGVNVILQPQQHQVWYPPSTFEPILFLHPFENLQLYKRYSLSLPKFSFAQSTSTFFIIRKNVKRYKKVAVNWLFVLFIFLKNVLYSWPRDWAERDLQDWLLCYRI